jgi:protein dithiol oxidoreductase (disulfide-forming)
MMMQRRNFTQTMAWSTVGAGVLPGVALAQPAAFKEGVDYLKLQRPVAVDAPPDKVEVIEFFGYWCPHCSAFEPMLEAWSKKLPPHVVLRRLPVSFRDETAGLQKLYFTLEAMGLLNTLHAKVFQAIHQQKQPLIKQDDIVDWVSKQGVDKAKFLEFYNSFGLAGKVVRANQVAQAFQIDGVPGLGVAGKYFTSGPIAQSMDRALKVVEHLAAISRKASN